MGLIDISLFGLMILSPLTLLGLLIGVFPASCAGPR